MVSTQHMYGLSIQYGLVAKEIKYINLDTNDVAVHRHGLIFNCVGHSLGAWGINWMIFLKLGVDV